MFINHTLKQRLLENFNDNSYINVHVEFFGDTRYDVSVILEIRVLSIYTSKYEGNKKSLYIGNILCMTKHICCFGWVFF